MVFLLEMAETPLPLREMSPLGLWPVGREVLQLFRLGLGAQVQQAT
jgi:hypothetical protein